MRLHINSKFSDLLNLYRSELLTRVMPFRIEHAVDWKMIFSLYMRGSGIKGLLGTIILNN